MPICPRGHESQAEDWCDFCGFPMTPPPGLAVPGAPSAAGAGPRPPAADPFGAPRPADPFGGRPAPPPFTPPPAPAGPEPTAGLATCPICRTPQTGRYCEDCGYDYDLASPARPQAPPAGGYGFPPPAAGQQPPPPPPSLSPPASPQAPPPASPYRPSPFERPAREPGGYEPGGYEPGGSAQPPYQPTAYDPPGSYDPAVGHEQPVRHEPPAFDPAPGYERPAGYERQGGYERPAAFERPGGYERPAAFEPGPAAAFPEAEDVERTGPVYAQPGPAGPGDEFGTSFHLAPPAGAASAPARTTWIAVVSADRDYFTDMMARSGPEAAGLFFPPYCPERRIPLTGRGQLRIGRRSAHRGTVPEIDLSVAPEDPGASHQHAMLAEQADGSWVLVDQDSTNGTTVNGSPDPVPPHTAIPLNDGDRVHVGAWTTITLHRS
ncbi:FHA domain-containing protein [Kitasatospora camelliae]|uniref:FHA domain-containing protein n=1 Tax=Kitasatospora camelliae TaxID=3156397 RepID=A0AAU8K360_9ACTN